MKKYFFLLCCLFTKTIIAQNLESKFRYSESYSFSSEKDSTAKQRTIYSIEKDTINVSTLQNWNTSKLIWENFERYEKVLDTNGMLTLDAKYQWYQEKNAWYEFAKTEKKYDTNKNLQFITVYQASGEVGRWTLKEKIEYAYDSTGNKTSEVRYDWDYGWKETVKMLNTYNFSNKVISDEIYQWDKDRARWGKNLKTVKTYDINNNIIEELLWRGSTRNETWHESEKRNFVYDKNNNIISKTSFEYGFQKKLWIKARKEDFTFDEKNRYSSHTVYGYDGIAIELTPLTKYEQAYDANGKVNLAITYDWDSKLKKWNKLEQYEDTYNNEGKMILQIHYHRNYTPVLHKLDKTEITYEGEKETSIFYIWDDRINDLRLYSKNETIKRNGNFISGSSYNWNNTSKSFIGTEKREYTYDSSNKTTNSKHYTWDDSIENWKIVSKTYNYSN